jgi:hypothetical protein
MSTFVIFPSKDFIFNGCSTFYFVEYVIVNVIIEIKLIITNKVISMILTVFMAMVLNSAFWLTALKVDTKVMKRIIFSYVAKLQLNLL